MANSGNTIYGAGVIEQWSSGKSQACHLEGPGFAVGTLQGVSFPVAAHHITLAWQWPRDWDALFIVIAIGDDYRFAVFGLVTRL